MLKSIFDFLYSSILIFVLVAVYMQVSMYSVVEFTDEDGAVAIVPTSWLGTGSKKGQCSWPPVEHTLHDVHKLMPALSSWKLYPMRELYRDGKDFEFLI